MRELKFRAYVLNENVYYDISTVDKPISNKGCHNFKGYELSSGYILRKVCGHPNSNSRGYYPEHRLIMEEKLGRLLLKNEVVHHKDGNKTNNDIENLELVENQSKHAKIEIQTRNRNDKGKLISEDSMLEKIKFRLYDKEREVIVIYTLSKLINTTFKRSKFEFRGRFTGLTDKTGKEIYEGDIIKHNAYWANKSVSFSVVELSKYEDDYGHETFDHLGWNAEGRSLVDFHDKCEIIGNIHEHPDLLEKI